MNSKNIDTTTPVLVISGDFHGHAVARSLGRLGIEVYGIHTGTNSPSSKSKYWKENFFWNINRHTPEESLEWLQNLSTNFEYKPILIATDDQTELFIDENSDLLSKFYLFHRRPDGLAKTLSNKKLLFYLCKKKSIPTPETIFPESVIDIENFNKTARFPVMLKGINTLTLREKFGVPMVIVNDKDSLINFYKKFETPGNSNLMIQEYIAGEAKDVWMFDGYFNSNSDCLFWVTGKKLRQNPVYVGMTSLGICETNEELASQVKSFMKAINYTGILDVGYKYNPVDGKYYLLDPNPRLGRTFRLFVDSNGMDVVRALYLDLTGQKVKIGNIVEGRKWVDEYLDIESSIRYWKDGNLKFKEWLFSFKNLQEAQWFALDDFNVTLSIYWYLILSGIKVMAKKVLPLRVQKLLRG